MIESSFCFLPGVGSTTERRLWRQGLLTWVDFLSRQSIDKIGAERKMLYDTQVQKAQEQYAGGNARYFGVILPAREQYIVTTSEFDDVKARLAAIENRRKVNDNDKDKPSLRRASTGGSGGDKPDTNQRTDKDKDKNGDDVPPVLHRRDD